MSLSRWDDDPCEKMMGEEFCRGCGRSLIETKEHEGYNRSDGEPYFTRWHSCPKYFMSLARNLLTLGTGGMGHDSHNADNDIIERKWK
jgi:hypothetical protein